MSTNSRMRQEMLKYCLEIHEDDGKEARSMRPAKGDQQKNNYRTDRLCRQVLETLWLVIAGDGTDNDLSQVRIVSVEPAPDATRLRVIVTADVGDDMETRAHIEAILKLHMPRLRSEVAAAITRKRAPTLVFQWRAMPSGTEEVR